jgi:hypothetical protein
MALEGGEGSASHPSRSLSLGKTQYSLYKRWGGPQAQSGQVQKISPPPGFDPQTVQPVAIHYTDYAARPTVPIEVCENEFPVILTLGTPDIVPPLVTTTSLCCYLSPQIVIYQP